MSCNPTITAEVIDFSLRCASKSLHLTTKNLQGKINEFVVDLTPLFTGCDGTDLFPLVDTRLSNPTSSCSSEGETILHFDVINVVTGEVVGEEIVVIGKCEEEVPEPPVCVEGLWKYVPFGFLSDPADDAVVAVLTGEMYGDGFNEFSNMSNISFSNIDSNGTDQSQVLLAMVVGDTIPLEYTIGVDDFTAVFQLTSLFAPDGSEVLRADVSFQSGDLDIDVFSGPDVIVDLGLCDPVIVSTPPLANH